jgi:ribonuclease HI
MLDFDQPLDSQNQSTNLDPKNTITNKFYTLFADGGSRGNPGPAASGIAVYESSSKFLDYKECQTLKPTILKGFYCGETTNNVAEWSGLREGLTEILKLDPKPKVQVYLDSQLVVRQVTGQYKVKQPHLQSIFLEVKKLINRLSEFQIEHIYREFNSMADSAVNECLDNV